MGSGEDYTAENEAWDVYQRALRDAMATVKRPLVTGSIVTVQLPQGMRKAEKVTK